MQNRLVVRCGQVQRGKEDPRNLLDVKIVGFDDVQYANLLPVPLTTIHQPCHDLGVAAAAAMLERLSSPNMPAREILLDCRLVVRDSCGARAFEDQSISRTSDGMLELTRFR